MPFDFPILYFIQEHLVSPILNSFMVFITSLGDAGVLWITSAIIMLLFKRSRIYGVLLLCAISLAFTAGELIIKNVVCRIRPCNIDKTINLIINRPSSYSFPSVHSATAFSSSTIIYFFNKKIGVVAYILALLIAFSRLYLFVHFPSDVIAGIILGFISAIITIEIYKILKNKAE